MLIKSQKNHSVPLGQSLILVLLLTGAVVVLLPLVIVFLSSLTPASATSSGRIWPKAVTLANYQEAWQRGGFLLAFANSTFVALTVTGFQIITSALAGYALARLKFRGVKCCY